MTDKDPAVTLLPRRRKLPKPRLQWRLVGTFLALSGTSLALQALLVAFAIARFGAANPGVTLTSEVVVPIVVQTLVLSCLIVLPVIAVVGILTTFRIAGPVYRIEQHLSAVARGEDPGPCRLRRGDDLQELADLVDRAVGAKRESVPGKPADEPADKAA